MSLDEEEPAPAEAAPTAEPLPPIETEALLDELATVGAAPAVRGFALGREPFNPTPRLTGLIRMGDKMARGLRGVIEPLARTRTQVSAVGLETYRYDDWRAKQPGHIAIHHYRLRALKGGMLLLIEPDFVCSLLESFYGGGNAGLPRGPRSAEMTPAEDRMLARLVKAVMALLVEVCSPVLELDPALAARETGASYVNLVRADDLVVIQQFTIMPGAAARAATISLVYPLAMLRPIEELLAARVHDEPVGPDRDWQARLQSAVEEIRLPVRSVLARPKMTVGQLMALKPGDVIPVAMPAEAPLYAGQRLLGAGTIGEQDGRAALMIQSMGQFR